MRACACCAVAPDHDARLAAVALLMQVLAPEARTFRGQRAPSPVSPAVVVPYSRNSRRLPTGDTSSDTSLWKILVAICR